DGGRGFSLISIALPEQQLTPKATDLCLPPTFTVLLREAQSFGQCVESLVDAVSFSVCFGEKRQIIWAPQSAARPRRYSEPLADLSNSLLRPPKLRDSPALYHSRPSHQNGVTLFLGCGHSSLGRFQSERNLSRNLMDMSFMG